MKGKDKKREVGREKEMESDGRRGVEKCGLSFSKTLYFFYFLIIKQRKSVGLVHVSYKTK